MAFLMKYSNVLGRFNTIQRLITASKSTTAIPSSDDQAPRPFSDMPGDSGWPFIGVVGMLAKLINGKVGKESVFHEIHTKHGSIVKLKSVGNQWLVFANEPDAVQEMFKAEGKYPSRNYYYESTINNIHKMNNWPSPMVFAHEEDWKRIRSATSKQVIPRRVGNLTPPVCDATDDLLNQMTKMSSENNGRIEDVMHLITKWAFQNTACFVFGENIDVYNTTDPIHQEFIVAGLEFIKQISLLKPLPIYDYFPSLAYRKFIQATRRMRELGKQIMEKKVVALSEDIARGVVDETRAVGILEQWLIEGKLEPEDALTQACDFLSAGLDTTKNSSTFLLYELAKQPALQDQLCAEIRTVLGDKVNPSWVDLQNIPLVRYCLKETLRMYPAIQSNIRQIQLDGVISGYEVPAGTMVFATNALMSRSTDYFDEPDKFIPERWNKKNKEDSIHPFISLPFGFGQRACYVIHRASFS
ncbi:probable cytochrome P450 49a1 isoform X2 [Halichondria panicea]|uniref:probable cytochrome P450 49a1 isoform X2 n=1 Tax=Halichondria panicea TaxID=6063 RepID=UPI00312B2F5A